MNEYFGKILIASPKLDQTPFARSVIYVFQDNEDATVGVVLNQPPNQDVLQAWQSMVGPNCQNGLVSIGGPMPGPILAIHQNDDAAELPLPNGLFAAASEENPQRLASQSNRPFQVFFGLCGWQQGQLDVEIRSGDWVASKATDSLFFQPNQDLWTTAIERMQNRFLAEVLGIKTIPKSAEDN